MPATIEKSVAMVGRALSPVNSTLLMPRETWKDKSNYDAKAKHLAELFHKNFEKFKTATDAVEAAGPKAG